MFEKLRIDLIPPKFSDERVECSITLFSLESFDCFFRPKLFDDGIR
tara:strand:- start:10497 stop:10634 length:138 start_codon:yes stop_codon:yes gene_type:complete